MNRLDYFTYEELEAIYKALIKSNVYHSSVKLSLVKEIQKELNDKWHVRYAM